MKKGYGRVAQKAEALSGAPLGELMELFGPLISLPDDFGSPKRKRLFSPSQTFWLFLSQVLAADGSCREVLRKFLAWLSLEEGRSASPLTGAYCKARARLSLKETEGLHEGLAERLEAAEDPEQRWCGRKVKVIDGSSVSMPDSLENQERYPQPSTQSPGCGFPVMRIVVVFSLTSGILLNLAKGSLSTHERILFHQLWDSFEAEEVALADRGFCSYADYYFLGKRGVDCVMRNHPRRKAGKEIKRLGKGDRLIHWKKTTACPTWLSKEEWQDVPDTLTVREVTITIDSPGFRSETIVVVTTLLDDKEFPREALAELYRRRWRAELYFRDIKISMGMDILRCKTPDMVEKELWMHCIAYNLIRVLMGQAAGIHGLDIERISFKGTVATVRQWAPVMAAVAASDTEQHERMFDAMLSYIARDPVPYRPNRREPRARKRRPKNYQLLTKPRHEFKEAPHRSRYKKPKKQP